MNKIIGTVKQYPYRTARVGDVILRVPRAMVAPLEQLLVEAADARFANHTVYEIIQPDMPPAYIMCSDSMVTIGRSVSEQRW
jgi:hypothetical protein